MYVPSSSSGRLSRESRERRQPVYPIGSRRANRWAFISLTCYGSLDSPINLITQERHQLETNGLRRLIAPVNTYKRSSPFFRKSIMRRQRTKKSMKIVNISRVAAARIMQLTPFDSSCVQLQCFDPFAVKIDNAETKE